MTWNSSVSGEDADGETLLDPDEREGLLFTHVRTRAELNALEQENIQQAEEWLLRQRKHRDYFSRDFLFELHRQMFGQVWRWAGQPRKTEKNIGVDPRVIAVELHNLLEDARVWVAEDSYPVLEFAARFHHRLVKINVFPNGNGRHARIMTEVLVQRELAETPPRWTGNRNGYLRALRAADQGDIHPLIAWVAAAGVAGETQDS
ncbi:MAG: mobile mystery protein B [Pseudomonadota bacterium]